MRTIVGKGELSQKSVLDKPATSVYSKRKNGAAVYTMGRGRSIASSLSMMGGTGWYLLQVLIVSRGSFHVPYYRRE